MERYLLVMLTTCVVGVWSWPQGAPSTACTRMTPNHGGSAQTANANKWQIDVSATQYAEGDSITVTLKSTDSTEIKGFLLVARTEEAGNAIVGSFSTIPANTKKQCTGETGVTHQTRLSTASLTFTYRAPATTTKNIYFVATVVQTKLTYWLNIRSSTLTPKPQSCVYNGELRASGSTFPQQGSACNTCTCTDGQVSCTSQTCATASKQCVYKGQTYAHNTTFKDSCNTCNCRDGAVGCTKMACPPPTTAATGGSASCTHKGATHAHGATFKDDCNTCTCMNGAVSCTEIGCSAGGTASCTHKGVTHTHGTSFKDDCNSCLCNNGAAGCTEMACPGCQYAGNKYAVGDKYTAVDGCNTCSCGADLQSACTLKACNKASGLHITIRTVMFVITTGLVAMLF